jgi:plasmid stabilization system protein ParE
MRPIDFLPGARRDFDESFDCYAARSTEAALRFAAAVEAALATIATRPRQLGTVDDGHWQYALKRFPFRIVYRVVEEQILVVAIAHASRRPGYWSARTA